jgi:hypothetical protein
MARSSPQNLQHLGAVRFRVKGSGTLNVSAFGYDDVEFSALPELTLEETTSRQPTILANFINQRICLHIGTTEEGEYFTINRIIPFVRPVATSYPQ